MPRSRVVEQLGPELVDRLSVRPRVALYTASKLEPKSESEDSSLFVYETLRRSPASSGESGACIAHPRVEPP